MSAALSGPTAAPASGAPASGSGPVSTSHSEVRTSSKTAGNGYRTYDVTRLTETSQCDGGDNDPVLWDSESTLLGHLTIKGAEAVLTAQEKSIPKLIQIAQAILELGLSAPAGSVKATTDAFNKRAELNNLAKELGLTEATVTPKSAPANAPHIGSVAAKAASFGGRSGKK